MKFLFLVCLLNTCALVWSCTSSSDCSELHICFSGTPSVVGKRMTNMRQLEGVCTLLKTEGQSCWVNGGTITSRPGHVVVGNLPCEVGFYCKGLGIYLQNFGEAGNCIPVGQ